MSRYRFSWKAFDDDTVRALAEAWGHELDIDRESLREWLGTSVKRPTPDFVRVTKAVLEQTWLPKYPGVQQIVERLIEEQIGPMNLPRSQRGCVDYIKACRNSLTIRSLLAEALIRFGDSDRETEDGDGTVDPVFVPRFAVLQPAKQVEDDRKPYPHQIEAWDRLTAHLAEFRTSGLFEGLLVMPTGSGKTFTAARWLTQHVLNQGERVVWLAHRHELIEQAASAFHRVAGLANKVTQLRVRVVSGRHCGTSQIDPADQVLLCSVASLARRCDIIEPLLRDPRSFLVIDEAHHAPAKSYRGRKRGRS
jgi:hypothetical protein